MSWNNLHFFNTVKNIAKLTTYLFLQLKTIYFIKSHNVNTINYLNFQNLHWASKCIENHHNNTGCTIESNMMKETPSEMAYPLNKANSQMKLILIHTKTVKYITLK